MKGWAVLDEHLTVPKTRRATLRLELFDRPPVGRSLESTRLARAREHNSYPFLLGE